MMNGSVEGCVKDRADSEQGNRQDGGQQISQSEGVTGAVIVEDNAGAKAGQGREGRG